MLCPDRGVEVAVLHVAVLPLHAPGVGRLGGHREELRAGAKVIFAGGFIGTIVEAREKTFKIEIAGDVVVEVARAAVQGLAAEEAPAAK